MYRTFLLLVLILACFFRCNYKQPVSSKSTNIEKVIANLTNRFSQLPKGKDKQSDYYKLVRSVTNGEHNFEIQLRASPDSLEDPQKIIVFINPLGECYAIPFFSNTYRDYWDFRFDCPILTLKSTKTTFAKELMIALDTLQLNDTIGTGGHVVNEMIRSLLQCIRVNESDSADMLCLAMMNNYDLPEETSESGFIRLKASYKEISSEWHQDLLISNYNAFLDRDNNRIYQIKDREIKRNKKLDLFIRVYRQDYVFHEITL